MASARGPTTGRPGVPGGAAPSPVLQGTLATSFLVSHRRVTHGSEGCPWSAVTPQRRHWSDPRGPPETLPCLWVSSAHCGQVDRWSSGHPGAEWVPEATALSLGRGSDWGTRQGVVPPPCTTRVSAALVTPGWKADTQDPNLKLHNGCTEGQGRVTALTSWAPPGSGPGGLRHSVRRLFRNGGQPEVQVQQPWQAGGLYRSQ